MAIPEEGHAAEGAAAERAGNGGFIAFVPTQRNRSARAGQWRRVAAFAASSVLVLAVVGFFQDATSPTTRSLAENAQSASQKPLNQVQIEDARRKLKVLQKKISENQDKASKLDAKVAKEEAAFKGKLLQAKSLEKKGKLEQSKEEQEKSQASKLQQKAVKAAEESAKAKQKFVSNEKPMEKATKLASHDQRAYRKAELAVADEVSKLSSDPTNAKLRADVGKLVKAAKTAKHTMEDDSTLLTNIEKKVASVQVGGAHSYNSLRAQSMQDKKEAAQLQSDAQMLASDAAKKTKTAHSILAKVEEEMKGPEKQHQEAVAARAEYKKQTALAHTLQQELEETGGADAVAGASDSSSSGSSSSDAAMSTSSSSDGGSSDDSSSLSSSKGPKILSQGQSTFLSGLFSNTAPWDKGFHK